MFVSTLSVVAICFRSLELTSLSYDCFSMYLLYYVYMVNKDYADHDICSSQHWTLAVQSYTCHGDTNCTYPRKFHSDPTHLYGGFFPIPSGHRKQFRHPLFITSDWYRCQHPHLNEYESPIPDCESRSSNFLRRRNGLEWNVKTVADRFFSLRTTTALHSKMRLRFRENRARYFSIPANSASSASLSCCLIETHYRVSCDR